mmetsp:Transcript_166424/g.534636  ORF Transcript_166424/g.534636 Transcript_166424/m.534636 type:complete len:222 (+) Transcript_166424:61-726(+)
MEDLLSRDISNTVDFAEVRQQVRQVPHGGQHLPLVAAHRGSCIEPLQSRRCLASLHHIALRIGRQVVEGMAAPSRRVIRSQLLVVHQGWHWPVEMHLFGAQAAGTWLLQQIWCERGRELVAVCQGATRIHEEVEHRPDDRSVVEGIFRELLAGPHHGSRLDQGRCHEQRHPCAVASERVALHRPRIILAVVLVLVARLRVRGGRRRHMVENANALVASHQE